MLCRRHDLIQYIRRRFLLGALRDFLLCFVIVKKWNLICAEHLSSLSVPAQTLGGIGNSFVAAADWVWLVSCWLVLASSACKSHLVASILVTTELALLLFKQHRQQPLCTHSTIHNTIQHRCSLQEACIHHEHRAADATALSVQHLQPALAHSLYAPASPESPPT